MTEYRHAYNDAQWVQIGNFTRTGQAGCFILTQNNFVRAFIPIAVSVELRRCRILKQALSEAEGAATGGNDLQEAINGDVWRKVT